MSMFIGSNATVFGIKIYNFHFIKIKNIQTNKKKKKGLDDQSEVRLTLKDEKEMKNINESLAFEHDKIKKEKKEKDIINSKDITEITEVKPIKKLQSGLAGLDEWLENMMAGISELAVCYQKDGIVQGYSMIPTNDIPTIFGDFEPTFVTQKGKAILKFLQTNCITDGGTYLVFKEAESSILRLYELPKIDPENKYLLPELFLEPTGTLFYEIALKLLDNKNEDNEKAESLARFFFFLSYFLN